MRRTAKALVLGLSLVISTPVLATAATLLVNADGQLYGARQVNVGGDLYDVEFRDGTCVELFGGCTEASNTFTFHERDTALSAAQALLDQVFIAQYDEHADLTIGIRNIVALVVTPWDLSGGGATMRVIGSGAANYSLASGVSDFIFSTIVLPYYDTTNYDHIVYGVWSGTSTVPEPTALLMIIPGLVGLVYTRRKRVLQ